jgi:hypothetical protein
LLCTRFFQHQSRISAINPVCDNGCANIHDELIPCLRFFVATELEKFSQAYSKASSLSYTAGVADFDSVNNFSKDQASEGARNGDSNLSQAKEAINEAKGSLDRIVSILQKAAG